MGASAVSPYKRYYNLFYKGLGLAHWAFDRESFVVSLGFNRGTLLYERSQWTKVKPGGYPAAFFGRESAEGRELWSIDGYDVHVIPWDRLLKRKTRAARRTERISESSTVNNLGLIGNVLFAVGDAGQVFRRTDPLTSTGGVWRPEVTLKPSESLVAITGRSLDDIWVAGEESVWHYNGSAWKRVRLPSRDEAIDIACGPKDVYVCGGETVVRIGPGGKATRFDAEGCSFHSAAFYKGAVYVSSRDTDDDEQIGIWTLTRRGLEQVDTGFPPGWEFQPSGQLEVRAGLLWSFGAFGVYVFDGKRWKQLPNPKVPA